MSKIEDSLTCPISKMIFNRPVVTNTGHTFEEDELQNYLKKSNSCPLTRAPITGYFYSYGIKSVIDCLLKEDKINQDDIYKQMLPYNLTLKWYSNLEEIKKIISKYRFTVDLISKLLIKSCINYDETTLNIILKNLVYNNNELMDVIDLFSFHFERIIHVDIILKMFSLDCNINDEIFFLMLNFIRSKSQFERLLQFDPNFFDRIFLFDDSTKNTFNKTCYENFHHINIHLFTYIINLNPSFFSYHQYIQIIKKIENYIILRVKHINFLHLIYNLTPYDDVVKYMRSNVVIKFILDNNFSNKKIIVYFDELFNYNFDENIDLDHNPEIVLENQTNIDYCLENEVKYKTESDNIDDFCCTYNDTQFFDVEIDNINKCNKNNKRVDNLSKMNNITNIKILNKNKLRRIKKSQTCKRNILRCNKKITYYH